MGGGASPGRDSQSQHSPWQAQMICAHRTLMSWQCAHTYLVLFVYYLLSDDKEKLENMTGPFFCPLQAICMKMNFYDNRWMILLSSNYLLGMVLSKYLN